MNKIKIVSGPKSWIEGEAIRQLEHTSRLPDIERVIGMPGLHPGQGCPVDAVFITRDRIFPHLVGTDIGCGMSLWSTSIKPGKGDRLAKKLKGLERGIEDPADYLKQFDVEPTGFEHSAGTIGLGNHFSELLVFDEIVDAARVAEICGDTRTLLLVHSGSRGYGEKILRDHVAIHRDQGIPLNNITDANEYMMQHQNAVAWAKMNRYIIANRFLALWGANGTLLKDTVHNFVERMPVDDGTVWLHRKGAIPSNLGPVVIPGSRGAHSYLVEPTGDHVETGWSLSHGAGRKMSRRDARVRFEKGKQSLEKITKTKFNSVVICEDRTILVEEVPEAYKDISRVIQDLVDHGLVRVLALLKPILTYKMKREQPANH
jgi:release factor H-coupled RctB family protein